MEIRSPCNSSSQTFSTVPAFPSVSTTPLPINSDAPRRTHSKFLTHGASPMALRPCSAEPSVLTKTAQRRLSQRSAAGMIDGDCSSAKVLGRSFQTGRPQPVAHLRCGLVLPDPSQDDIARRAMGQKLDLLAQLRRLFGETFFK
jgi:hypothetical protein